MNARMHGIYHHEVNNLGRYVFGAGTQYMDQKRKEGIIFNRDLLMQVATTDHVTISNTTFQTPPEKLIAHRNIGVEHGPPWAPERYGTTDYIMVNKTWKNMINDAEARTDLAIPTYRFLLIRRCKIKLKADKNKDSQHSSSQTQ